MAASSSAAKASNKATDKTLALQRDQANQTRADLVPFMQPGYAAAGALSGRLGLSAPTSGGGYGPASATGGATYLPGSMTPAGSAGFSTADLNTIRQANPGIATEFARASAAADPNSPAFQQAGLGSIDDYTKHWYDTMRNPADYSLQPQGQPQGQQPQPATGAQPNGPAPGAPSGPSVPTGTFGNATNPSYTDPGAFSYTADDYKASPAYQYTVDQAMKGAESSAANAGALRSGATLKALQDRASNLAYQDFGNERNFARASYDTDRAFNRQTYTDDRNYLSGRYDTETGNLFNLAGMGENAAAGAGNAGAHYADTASNALMSNAGNVGNAALAGANATTGLLSSGVNALAYSQGYGGGAKPPTGPNTYAYSPSMVNLSGYTPSPYVS